MSKKKIKVLAPKTGYDLAAAGYDKKEGYLNSFEQGKLLPLLGVVKGKKILDVGAGTGRLAIELAKRGAAVMALDASAEMLERLRSKIKLKLNLKIETVSGEAENLPFPNDSFDIVVAAFLIVHLKDPSLFFRAAYRVLKDGGPLVVTNVNQPEPPEIKTPAGLIKIESYYYRPERIRELLAEQAFSVEKEILVREGENWVNQIVLARK